MLKIIDYSPKYFQNTLPAQRGGKFVVLYHGMQQYVLFAPIEMAGYHANIVARFSAQHQISGYYNDKRDVFSLHTSDWVISGGGYWALNEHAATLRLYGCSVAYGSVNLAALARQLAQTPVFEQLRITLD